MRSVSSRATDVAVLKNLQTSSGAYPFSYSMVMGAVSLGVKWLGNEADLSCPRSVTVKNEWSYTSTYLYAFVI
jgi:hypothetical protein